MVMELEAIALLMPATLSAAAGDGAFTLFAAAAIASFAIGTALHRSFPSGPLSFGSLMALSALSYLSASLFGAIPYLGSLSAQDAIFESVSGFTATGMTAAVPEALPASLLLWRSFSQWLGGLGALAVFALLTPAGGISSYHFYRAGWSERLEPANARGAVTVGMIYLSYTALGAALFVIAAVPPFEAALLSMSSVSTGGFSTRSGTLAAFGSPYVACAAFVLMILGSTSFLLHRGLWKGRLRHYASNPEARAFWALILASILVLALAGQDAFGSAFLAVSALSGTGYQIAAPAGLAVAVAALLVTVGGMSGSTSGGMKLIRAIAAARGGHWYMKKLALPRSAIIPLRIGTVFIKQPQIKEILAFAALYLAFLGASAAFLAYSGYAASDSLLQAASALGNAAFSPIPPASMTLTVKAVLALGMLAGRLEIFPLLALLMLSARAMK